MSELGNKEIMSRNLKKYIALSGKERKDIAKELGFSYSTFTDWINGNTYPRIDRIEMLADYFNIKKSNLIEEYDPIDEIREKFQEMQRNIDPELPFKIMKNTKSIPLIGTIAAGQPLLAEENIEDYFNIDTSIKADFALRIKGDSMIGAGIFQNDIVFIRQQDCLENGEIGAILIEDSATLKKFYKENDTVILQSENDYYKPMIFKEGNICILGKLVAVLNIRE